MDEVAGCGCIVAVLVILVFAALVWTVTLAAFVLACVVAALIFVLLLPAIIEGGKQAWRRDRTPNPEEDENHLPS